METQIMNDQEIKIILCLALTFSSTIIASKSLEERKELNSFHGKISIIILILYSNSDAVEVCRNKE